MILQTFNVSISKRNTNRGTDYSDFHEICQMCVRIYIFVQRESEKRSAGVWFWMVNSRYPCGRISSLAAPKPASTCDDASEINQWLSSPPPTVIDRQTRTKGLPLTIRHDADWSLDRPEDTKWLSRCRAVAYKVRFLLVQHDVLMRYRRSALRTELSKRFSWWLTQEDCPIRATVTLAQNGHVENARRRNQVTYLGGWWRCPSETIKLGDDCLGVIVFYLYTNSTVWYRPL